MIPAILTFFMILGLLYGRVAFPALVAGTAIFSLLLWICARHEHCGDLPIDRIAQQSRLHDVNPKLKFFAVLGAMALVLCSQNPVNGVLIGLMMLLLTVCVGRLPLHAYLSLLSVPLSFLLLSGIALLMSFAQTPNGVLAMPLFDGWYLNVTQTAQQSAALVISRAFGAVSCLYLLSLSTPMSEIIGVLRFLHCPSVLIELMYLIYRYIFILLDMHHTMRDAAKSRLGFSQYRTSVRTTGQIYANLLARSYRQAYTAFDAMESRAYDGEIRFLEPNIPCSATQIGCCTVILASIAVLVFCL